MIPKIIHYCWFGKNPMPKYVHKCIQSWKKFCPDFQIIRWDETNYDIEKNEFVRQAYSAKKWAFVSDYARIDILYNHGGIYLDTDVELLKSLNFLLTEEAYFGIQQDGCFVNTGLGFGSVQFHPILKKMLDEYNSLEFNLSQFQNLACPYINTKILSEVGFQSKNELQNLQTVTIYPAKYFDPISTNALNLLCEDSVSIHHYGGAWLSKGNGLKRRLYMFIGEKRIIKLKRILKWKK